METIKVEFDKKEIKECFGIAFNKMLKELIDKYQSASGSDINLNDSIKKLFDTGDWNNRHASQIQQNLDWAIESCYNVAVTEVVEELGLKDAIKKEIEVIVSNPKWIKEMASQKVAQALGVKLDD